MLLIVVFVGLDLSGLQFLLVVLLFGGFGFGWGLHSFVVVSCSLRFLWLMVVAWFVCLQGWVAFCCCLLVVVCLFYGLFGCVYGFRSCCLGGLLFVGTVDCLLLWVWC